MVDAVKPDSVAGPFIEPVPGIRVVERECGDAVLVVEFARVETFGDEIDAERRPPVPGPLLARAVQADRHVALVDLDDVVSRPGESPHGRGIRLGDQDVRHRVRNLE